MRKYYLVCSKCEKVQKASALIPWSHNMLIFDKIKNDKERLWYINQTASNDWVVFSLFTKKDYRGKGLGYKTLKLIVEEIKKYNPSMIVSGIEEDNISSIKVHESVGFKNSFMKWDEIDEGFPDDYLGFIIK